MAETRGGRIERIGIERKTPKGGISNVRVRQIKTKALPILSAARPSRWRARASRPRSSTTRATPSTSPTATPIRRPLRIKPGDTVKTSTRDASNDAFSTTDTTVMPSSTSRRSIRRPGRSTSRALSPATHCSAGSTRSA